jgi:prevent-host-death family protein
VVTRGYTDHMIANVRMAKARLSELLERATAGEEVVITRQGKPIARLVALAADTNPFRVNRGLLRRKVRRKGARSEVLVREDRNGRD